MATKEEIREWLEACGERDVQGPTFAEWKKAKGREGKVEKITKMLEEAYGGTMLWPKNIARKILDAIEGEGK